MFDHPVRTLWVKGPQKQLGEHSHTPPDQHPSKGVEPPEKQQQGGPASAGKQYQAGRPVLRPRDGRPANNLDC